MLAAEAAVAHLAAGPVCKRLKRMPVKPIILFGLHGVLLDGDFFAEDLAVTWEQ